MTVTQRCRLAGRVSVVIYCADMTFDKNLHKLPQALSPSRLGDFSSCPRRYQYASIERIPQPATYATLKGRLVHYVLEHLMQLAPAERSVESALGLYGAAADEILTSSAKSDIEYSAELGETLRAEVTQIIHHYFSLENPEDVTTRVELPIRVSVESAPLFGILDRLDTNDDGDLVIVDYKTGAIPDERFLDKAFVNCQIYALLCQTEYGKLPKKIRLFYVGKGSANDAIAIKEKEVSQVVVDARGRQAVETWQTINEMYEAGNFPAMPNKNTCRFCAYKDRCPEYAEAKDRGNL